MRVVVRFGTKDNEIECEPALGMECLKMQLFSLTAVPPERMRLVLRGRQIPDDADLEPLLTPGAKLLVVGSPTPTATPAPAAAPAAAAAAAPAPAAPAPAAPLVLLAGFPNGGWNTCYLNSTLQALRSVAPFRRAIAAYSGGDPLAASLQGAYTWLDAQVPNEEVVGTAGMVMPPAYERLHAAVCAAYPQFGERDGRGGLLQHDADEFFSLLLQALDATAGAASPAPLFRLAVETTHTCIEEGGGGAAAATTARDVMVRLPVSISRDALSLLQALQHQYTPPTGSTAVTASGAAVSADAAQVVTKHCPALGRDAAFRVTTLLAPLPPPAGGGAGAPLPEYLCINLLRFEWKQLGDAGARRVKVLRALEFPFVLDVYPIASAALRTALDPHRKPVLHARGLLPGGAAAAAPPAAPAAPAVGNVTGWYELCAVVTHKGRSAAGGHYVAWVRAGPSTWMCFDDTHVSQVPSEKIRELAGGGDFHTAYLLMYRSRAAPGAPAVGPA